MYEMLRTLVVVGVALVVATGCHKDSSLATPAPSPAPVPMAAPVPSQEVITLQSAGSGPLRTVAYRRAERTRTARLGVDGMVAQITWKAAGGAATPLRYRYELAGLTFPGSEPGKEEGEILKTLVGKVGGTVASDEHGRAHALNDSDLFRISPSIPDFVKLAVVPLPTEPIGQGARWRVVGKPVAGAPIISTLDYQALELNADGAKVHWTGHYDAEGGGKMSTIDGTATIRFDDLLPIHAALVQQLVLDDQIGAAAKEANSAANSAANGDEELDVGPIESPKLPEFKIFIE